MDFDFGDFHFGDIFHSSWDHSYSGWDDGLLLWCLFPFDEANVHVGKGVGPRMSYSERVGKSFSDAYQNSALTCFSKVVGVGLGVAACTAFVAGAIHAKITDKETGMPARDKEGRERRDWPKTLLYAGGAAVSALGAHYALIYPAGRR